MDELEIDLQILYPSLFLRPLTAKLEVENAICRSYNRWLIDICAKSEGRLRWVAVVPVIDIESAVKEVNFAKANGACGVFMRGLVDDKRLSHPTFFHFTRPLKPPDCRSACTPPPAISIGCSCSTAKAALCASRRRCSRRFTPLSTTAFRSVSRVEIRLHRGARPVGALHGGRDRPPLRPRR